VVRLGFLHHQLERGYHFQIQVRVPYLVTVQVLGLVEQELVELDQVIEQLVVGVQATKECHLLAFIESLIS
jgi:hypothetical protein